MRKLSKVEWTEHLDAIVRSLTWRIDGYQLHRDDAEVAALWCARNGVSAGQYLDLCIKIGERILRNLDSDERELLWAMGQGPCEVEEDADDLPS